MSKQTLCFIIMAAMLFNALYAAYDHNFQAILGWIVALFATMGSFPEEEIKNDTQ